MEIYLALISIGTGALATSVSLLLPALGENVSQRAGVLNVGTEGYMLTGALIAYFVYVWTGNQWLGFAMGMLAGATLSLSHSLLSVTLKCNQIVSGIGIWILGAGLNAYIFQLVGESTLVRKMEPVGIPLLEDIPFIGPILFHQNVMVYIALVLVAVFSVVLYKTPWGLLNKGAGDSPLSTDMAGHNVFLIRYASVTVCGLMAGLGGAYLAIGVLSRFTEEIVAGRGFIAIAIVIFGNWDPKRILGGVLLFSIFDGIQLYLQATSSVVPYPLLIIMPYLLTIILLAATSQKASNMPRKLAVPYFRGEE